MPNKCWPWMWLLGNTIATSYLPQIAGVKVDNIAIKTANTPKSPGEYILVRTGLTKAGTAWAKAVPLARTIKELQKEFLFTIKLKSITE